MWDQYRRYIIGATLVVLAQAALIAGLLVQRERRQRFERALRDSERELRGSERALRGSQAKLRLSYNQIRHLSRRLLGEQEAERGRLARELHDDISQQLTLLSMELDRIRGDQPQVDDAMRLSRAMQIAQGVAASVRDLSHRLHPSRLQLIGLVAGLDSLRHDLSPSHLPIAFSHRDVPADVDPDIALCMYRVAQEALANAVKHGGADHVWVDVTGDSSSLGLTITDDGKGFDVDTLRNTGLGLISMRERVEAVGGHLEIHSTPGAGTSLRVTVPVHASHSAFATVPSA